MSRFFKIDLGAFTGNDGFVLVKDSDPPNKTDSQDPGNIDTIVTDGNSKVIKYHHKSTGSDGMDGTVVPVVAIVFVFIWLIVKALMAPFTQKAARRGSMPMSASSAGLTDEEQAVLLKLQRTLTDMERRIESLETILIDEHRTKENYGSKI